MGLILCATTWAQMPEKGKFYRIKNASYGLVMNENWGVGTVNCVGQNEDYNQLWQYTDQGSVPGIKGNVDIDLMFTDYGLGKEIFGDK